MRELLCEPHLELQHPLVRGPGGRLGGGRAAVKGVHEVEDALRHEVLLLALQLREPPHSVAQGPAQRCVLARELVHGGLPSSVLAAEGDAGEAAQAAGVERRRLRLAVVAPQPIGGGRGAADAARHGRRHRRGASPGASNELRAASALAEDLANGGGGRLEALHDLLELLRAAGRQELWVSDGEVLHRLPRGRVQVGDGEVLRQPALGRVLCDAEGLVRVGAPGR
mmetsp:Transcript_58307/g.187282  ORF Transcript_58307/g.187282 Transcript_58307/m.187282 type:complete len:225 (+) Transcript_58307:319-993(+)